MPPILAIFAALLIVAFDQLSKHYVVSHMNLGQSIPVIEEIFHFTYVLNSGAAFGIMKNQTVLFIVIAFLVLGGGVYFFFRTANEHRLLRLGITLVGGGAAGNLIDRAKTGLVVDFLDFRFWPVFNIADIAIVAGAGLVAFAVLFSREEGLGGGE